MKLIQKLNTNHKLSVVKSTILVPERCKKIILSKNSESSIDNFFRNRIDISFFDESGKWYGRFDRGRDEFVIEDDSDLRGFLASGKWNVYFEVFQIFEEIEITLDISFECYEGYRSYTGELHTHTNLTDGQLSFAEMSGYLDEKNYDFFFMADHNSIAAWEGFKTLNRIKGYRAQELTTFYGHVLLFGLSDYVSWYDGDGNLKSIETLREEVRLKGGIMGIAHPFTSGGFFYPGCRWTKKIEPEHLDFLEIWNSKIESSDRNWEAINYWLRLLKEDVRIVGTCGADFHRYADLDKALKMRILSVKNNEYGIVDAIRKGRTYISGKSELSFEVDGKTFGQTILIENSGEENEVHIKYHIKNCDVETSIFLCSKREMRRLGKRSDSFIMPIANENDFLLLIGIKGDKELEFISNPVFVRKIVD